MKRKRKNEDEKNAHREINKKEKCMIKSFLIVTGGNYL